MAIDMILALSCTFGPQDRTSGDRFVVGRSVAAGRESGAWEHFWRNSWDKPTMEWLVEGGIRGSSDKQYI